MRKGSRRREEGRDDESNAMRKKKKKKKKKRKEGDKKRSVGFGMDFSFTPSDPHMALSVPRKFEASRRWLIVI